MGRHSQSLQFFLSLVLTFCTWQASALSGQRQILVKLSRVEYQAHISEVRKNNMDVAGVDIPGKSVYLLIDQKTLILLTNLGLHPVITKESLGEQSPDKKYKTPDQVATILNQLAASYPNLAQVLSLGKSLQGRDILALKITSHVRAPMAAKPAILFNGMHHAREVMSTEVPLDIATLLLSKYGTDAKVTHWVDANEIYVIPMLNVDGNNIVWTSDSMWRKNAREDYGVDLNRNYPFGWNSCNGSSSNTDAQDYRGPSPASEPETNVLMNFVATIHPVFDISFHSFSELVIYPYGCGGHTETSAIVEPLGRKMAELVVSDDGHGRYSAGTAPELLYAADGSDIDWLYHEQHVIPYVIEVNSFAQGFQPLYDKWRDSTVARLRPAWQLLLDRLDGPTLIAEITNSHHSAGRVSLHIQSTRPSVPFVLDYQIQHLGIHRIVLNPGTYKITINGARTPVAPTLFQMGNKHLSLKVDL